MHQRSKNTSIFRHLLGTGLSETCLSSTSTVGCNQETASRLSRRITARANCAHHPACGNLRYNNPNDLIFKVRLACLSACLTATEHFKSRTVYYVHQAIGANTGTGFRIALSSNCFGALLVKERVQNSLCPDPTKIVQSDSCILWIFSTIASPLLQRGGGVILE